MQHPLAVQLMMGSIGLCLYSCHALASFCLHRLGTAPPLATREGQDSGEEGCNERGKITKIGLHPSLSTFKILPIIKERSLADELKYAIDFLSL